MINLEKNIQIFVSFCRAIRAILANIYIAPTRPLYPTRRPTEPKKATNIVLTANRDVFILVNLIGATDLPVRHQNLEMYGNVLIFEIIVYLLI